MNRKEFLNLLTVASQGLSDNNLVAIHKCFLFNEGKVIAFNDTLGVIAPSDIGNFAINGQTLMGLLSASQSENIEIAVDGADVVVKAARSTFKLPWFLASDFPYEDPEGPWDVTIPITEDLLDGLEICLKTSSKDLTKEAWCGITIPINKSVLYASDGDAVTSYELENEVKSPKQFTLRNEFCEALLKLTEKGFKKASLKINNDWASAEFGSVKLFGRMINITAPIDFQSEIKKTVKGTPIFYAEPDGLQAALARARVVADHESAKTTVTVENGRLRLLTEASVGVVRDNIAFPEHPDVTAHVSAELMEKSLKYAKALVLNENYCAFKSEKVFILTANME